MAIASTTTQRLVAAGKVYWDQFNAAGVKTGERYLGLTPGFTVSVKSDTIESYSAETGVRQLDDRTLISVTRTGTLSVRQVSLENLALFVGGSAITAAQTSGAVSNEAVSVLADRYYQLGATVANPSGVRNVTSITATAATPTSWAATTAKALGAQVQQLSSPTHVFQCTTAGTTGGTAPTWVTTLGGTTTDGTVTWTCIGIITPVLGTDYTVDQTAGRVYILPTARVSATYPVPWLFGYTKTTVSRDQISTAGLPSAYGALRYLAANAKGANRDLYGCNVMLAPTGDWILSADDPKYVELEFEVSFSLGANGEPALMIDGQAY